MAAGNSTVDTFKIMLIAAIAPDGTLPPWSVHLQEVGFDLLQVQTVRTEQLTGLAEPAAHTHEISKRST